VEYESGNVLTELISKIEAGMNEYLASKLMPCGHADRRQLQEEIGIVAIDSREGDEVVTTGMFENVF